MRACIEKSSNLPGIERCQCRKQRIQRNHISCAFLVWAFLKNPSCQLIYKSRARFYEHLKLICNIKTLNKNYIF
ncbi:hypothetical protein [Candidatus Tisiphia endosymbiont of Dascillus cervinus]|uniref:hypothetical protein n=1 Tax=Candidatus Tisiphia endosymbiont of Dascillus cervinus TaxID=3066253 RepID=UPI00312CBDA2